MNGSLSEPLDLSACMDVLASESSPTSEDPGSGAKVE